MAHVHNDCGIGDMKWQRYNWKEGTLNRVYTSQKRAEAAALKNGAAFVATLQGTRHYVVEPNYIPARGSGIYDVRLLEAPLHLQERGTAKRLYHSTLYVYEGENGCSGAYTMQLVGAADTSGTLEEKTERCSRLCRGFQGFIVVRKRIR